MDRLRGGDESAFVALVDRYSGSMLRLASLYANDPAVAEDVVQETWLGVLRGIRRFEGRSSLRTWIFHILLNRARTRRRRDGRLIPFSSYFERSGRTYEPAVDPDLFLPADHPQWPGHWRLAPESWDGSPEARLIAAETSTRIERVVADLPPAQREVITLRDIEGWSAKEVCRALRITASNQRVLLHRARARVRRALEDLLREA